MIMNRLLVVLMLLGILNITFSYAQEGEDFTFPDEIVALEYKESFSKISDDSMRKIIHIATDLSDNKGQLYKYVRNDSVFIIVNTSEGWKSLFNGFDEMLLYGSGLDYELVEINSKGTKGLLILNYENFSKGARYYSIEYRSCSYRLINVDDGTVYYLGMTYTDEGNEYKGYRYEDGEDEEKEMKEMEKMEKMENWDRRYTALEYTIHFLPNKVRFENISCTGCEVAGLGTVGTIEYLWKDEKLIKDKVIQEQK